MSETKPQYGPHVPGTENAGPDLHHRRAADLPGRMAQRLDTVEAAMSKQPRRLAAPGGEAVTAVAFDLASGESGHDVSVISLMAGVRNAAVALGLNLREVSVRRWPPGNAVKKPPEKPKGGK